MGIWQQIKSGVTTYLIGTVIKDFGVVSARKAGLITTNMSLLLCEKKGQRELVLKSASTGGGSSNIYYIGFDYQALVAFKQAIDESLPQMFSPMASST